MTPSGDARAEALAAAVRRHCNAAEAAASSDALPGLDGIPGRQLAALGQLLCGRKLNGVALPEPVRRWLQACGSVEDRDVQEVADAAFRADRPEVILAATYERLVPPNARRRLGTYFTPPVVVDFMIDLVRQVCDPQVVVDAGAGVGALAIAAHRAWPNAAVHAIDVNPAALGLLALAWPITPVSASDQRSRKAARNLQLECQDYLSWVQTAWTVLPEPRVLLANPPFTRHQSRDSSAKLLAATAASPLVTHRTASLATYILAATMTRLGSHDSLCVILPDTWLQATYASVLRAHLASLRDRSVDLHALPDDGTLFPDARTRAMILVVGPEGSRPRLATYVAARRSGGLTTTLCDSRDLPVIQPQDDLVALLWRETFTGPSKAPAVTTRDTVRGSAVALDSLVRLRRGVATGANRTFLLSERQAQGLHQHDVLRPAVHRLTHIEGDVLDHTAHLKLRLAGRRCWLVDIPDIEPRAEAIVEWRRQALADGVPDRELCRRRTAWSKLQLGDPPVVLLAPMTTCDRFRLVLNDFGAHITNNLFGLWPRAAHVDPRGWHALTSWLNSDEAQSQWRRVAKRYSGGLLKLEPRAARSIMVPAEVAAELIREQDHRAPSGPMTQTRRGDMAGLRA